MTTYRYNGYTREEFIQYLETVAIPAAKEDGYSVFDLDVALHFLRVSKLDPKAARSQRIEKLKVQYARLEAELARDDDALLTYRYE